jgi:acyl-CoA thioesterase-1
MGYRFQVTIVFLYGLLCGSGSLANSEYRQAASSHTVLVLGDSISAAYGIDKRDGWVALLERRLEPQCPRVNIHNASVSGETSAGGLARLPGLLATHQPRLLVIELGGNDGLRGLSPQQMGKNLQQMIALAEGAGAQVALLGMLMPPNLGAAYVRLFEQAMAGVAEDESVLFQTFFLQGVAGQRGLLQVDGLHPTAAAQPLLLDNAWQLLEKPLAEICQSRTGITTL